MKVMIKNLIKLVIKKILSLVPIDEKLIILEGNKSYDDNARSLFELMIQKGLNNKYRFIWFVDNVHYHKHLEKIHNVKVKKYILWRKNWKQIFSLLQFCYYNAAAANCIFCNSWLGFKFKRNKGQRRIYLGHGITLKKVNMGMGDDYDMVVSTSDFANEVQKKLIPGCDEKLVITGYPRNDFLFHTSKAVTNYFLAYQNKKKIMWMPTFKRLVNSDRNDFQINKERDISLLNEGFIERINKKLSELNVLLVIKFHPFQDLRYVSNFKRSNILTLSRTDIEEIGCATYDFLSVFDALVTDFSTVAYDFSLLDRPLAFDCCDERDYKNGLGFLVDNIEDYMPGPIIKCEADFERFVCDVANGEDNHREDRRKLREKFNAFKDDNSAQRVLEAIAIN